MASLPLFSIAEIEQETGIKRDTLRVWERRYGYPVPHRNERGERKYSGEQLGRLRLIKQLMDSGMQPGKLVPQDDQQLLQLTVSTRVYSPDVEELLDILARGALYTLMPRLEELLQRHGVRNFLTDVVAPLNEAVGKAWFAGRIGIRDEHYYTEQLRRVLALVQPPQPEHEGTPLRALLSTFPGEPHGIGLLMVECTLSKEGVEVLSLGVQTPLVEIVRGAVENRCNIVGISCSEYLSRRTIAAQLVNLRTMLPENITLWAGGCGVRTLTFLDKKIRIFTELQQIPAAVAVEINARAFRTVPHPNTH
jgi:methylmalonyl-CoA mutase cobalamin-binding subunit